MLLKKPEIVERLRALVAQRAGSMQSIGGDCYALCVSNEIRAAVAVKEFVKQGKGIWIGVPNPVLTLVTGERSLPGMETPHPFRGLIVGSHVPYKTLLLIPVVPVAQDLVARASADRTEIRDDFDVKMIGYKKYVIKGERFKGDIPLKHVDTFEPIEILLNLPRAQFEADFDEE